MVARNMSELNAMLIKEMNKAMRVVAEKDLADMYGETGKFYTGKSPKMYQRTGALGDTPRTTSNTVSGNTVFFEAYLDTNHQYTTGDNPNMQQVLELANYGKPWITRNGDGVPAKPTVGKKGFWEASEKKMEKNLKQVMGRFFKKI